MTDERMSDKQLYTTTAYPEPRLASISYYYYILLLRLRLRAEPSRAKHDTSSTSLVESLLCAVAWRKHTHGG